ncbi:MAG: TlpA family protein disulfide reductase [Sulfurovum sp.]|nr:TlpA family protein disulfide reductase [Sulfurovaceae bacterium]
MRKITLLVIIASFFTILNASDDKMSVSTVDGKKINIIGTEEGLKFPEYSGKVIFLEFFGHRCPPCIKSIPHYKKLQAKYQNKLAIIAIEVQGLDNGDLKSFARKKGINYDVIAQEKAGDLVRYIATRAEWQGAIPFLVVLDTKGNVQLVQAGMLPESALENLINKLSK